MRDDALREQLKQSIEAYNALTPLERAIADLEQKRSMVRGLSDHDTPAELINAALDKRPEFVLLAAYEEARATITRLTAERDEAIVKGQKLEIDLDTERRKVRIAVASADDIAQIVEVDRDQRIADLEAQLATAREENERLTTELKGERDDRCGACKWEAKARAQRKDETK